MARFLEGMYPHRRARLRGHWPPVRLLGVPPFLRLAAVPAFDREDVEAFFRERGQATVTAVEFLPASAVHARLHTSTGSSDDRLFCLATLAGTFIIRGAPLPPGHQQRVAVAHVAYQVFDAHTGNTVLFVSGPLEAAR